MDIKSEYEKLYNQWLEESEQIKLTQLTKEIYSKYKKSLDYINNFKLDKTDQIILELINSYKENFNYLFNDFTKIREIKIINAALLLKEIDLNVLLDAEKLFYQNLISTIKGFERVKTMEVDQSSEIFQSEDNEGLKLTENIEFNKSKSSIESNQISESILVSKSQNRDFNYILVRFLKKTPPLVGIDFLNYGPFENEDVANLPYKNAIILINERMAEKIEIP